MRREKTSTCCFCDVHWGECMNRRFNHFNYVANSFDGYFLGLFICISIWPCFWIYTEYTMRTNNPTVIYTTSEQINKYQRTITIFIEWKCRVRKSKKKNYKEKQEENKTKKNYNNMNRWSNDDVVPTNFLYSLHPMKLFYLFERT